MSVGLLDVNVLVALFDPAHLHHEPAHRWLAKNQKHGWATCPHALNGCIRVFSNPVYPTVDVSPGDVITHLKIFCSNAHHEFWPDSISLLDDTLFQSHAITGHRMLTDIYLLGLAVRRHGKLVTFDTAIPLRSVRDATNAHLEVLL